MTTTVFTQLSAIEFQAALLQALETYFTQKAQATPTQPLPEIGGIALAEEITGLKKATLYGLACRREIPYMKQGKRLYFKRAELVEWIESGRKYSSKEIAAKPGIAPRGKGKNPQ